MRITAIILVAGLPTVLYSGELQRTVTIGTASDDREAAWNGHIEFASWLDDETIVYWSRMGDLTCRDIKSDIVLWTSDELYEISDWSVSRKQRRLAVIHKTEDFIFANELIRVINCEDGSVEFSADRDEIARLLNLQFCIPTRIALKPPDARLVIGVFSTHFGRNGFVLNDSFSGPADTFEIDAMPSKVSISSDGARITVVAHGDVLCVRDLAENKDVYLHGERILESPKSIGGSIDAPFISHAQHDGDETIVYTIDNSWATGRVIVRNLTTDETRSYDAHNGHIELDVNFTNRRIALTGTSTDLTVMDFDGATVAHLPDATLQRNACVEFSPSGEQVLVGSWDNTLSIFTLSE